MIGVLVDLSSSILHQRRPPGIGRPEQSKPLQKTIGFSDSHQIVGDWYSFMLDNESTSDQNQTRRLAANPESTLRKPYAHWHDRPLQRHAGGDEVCATCKGGEYHAHPIELTGDECRTFHQTNPPGLSLRSGTCQNLISRKLTRLQAWTRANTLNMENAGGSPQRR